MLPAPSEDGQTILVWYIHGTLSHPNMFLQYNDIFLSFLQIIEKLKEKVLYVVGDDCKA